MNPDIYEQLYDKEVKPILNDLKRRRNLLYKKREQIETELLNGFKINESGLIEENILIDKGYQLTTSQIKFTNDIISLIESMWELTQGLRTNYWKEVERFTDVEIAMNKEKLLNNYLSKELSNVHNGDRLLARIQAKLPSGYKISTIRVDYTCIAHKELGCKQCREIK